MAYTPRPGNLRHRVTIGYTSSEIGENGYPADVDTELCTVWAEPFEARTDATHLADASTAKHTLEFVIRKRDDVREGMWVLWHGVKRYITEVYNYSYSLPYQRLTCSAPAEGVRQ